MTAPVRAGSGKAAPARSTSLRGWFRGIGRRLAPVFGNWYGIIAAILLLTVLIGATAASLIAGQDPYRGDFQAVYQGPSSGHILGTDGVGRDIFARMLHGGRTSLKAGAIAVSVGLFVGSTLGMVAGYVGRTTDRILSSVVDSLMSVPSMMLAMVIIVALGRGVVNAMLAVGIVASPTFFRVARAAVIDAKHEGYVEAATMIGCKHRRIIFVHILPHCLAPIAIVALLAFGYSILAEAGLSFLGLAATPPTASWGAMLADAASRYDLGYLMYAPAGCLIVTSLGFTLLGEALRKGLGTRVEVVGS